MPSTSQRLKKGVVLIAILFSATVAGAFLGSFIRQWVGEIAFDVPAWYILVPALVLLAFFTIVIHELGHVVGGMIARFRFVMLVAGPFKVQREKGRLVWGLNKWMQMSGGLALCVPQDQQRSKKGLLQYIAGGPVASLMAGLLCALAVFYLYRNDGNGYLLAFFMFTALFNGGIALITLLPLPTVGFENDGKQLLDILRGGKKANIKLLLHALSAEAIKGVRPREWTAEYIDQMLELVDGEVADRNAIVANLMGYYHAMDRGEVEGAARFIAFLVNHINESPSHLQNGLWLEIIFFQARYPRHQHDVSIVPAEVSGPFVEKYSLARLEAAVLFQEEQYEEACLKAAEGIALAQKATMQAGMVAAETDWMQAIVDDCQAKRLTKPEAKNH